MVGRVIRYQADLDDPLLYDDRGKRYNPDPDFASNHLPVWAICGPEIRDMLKKGDVLFFTPKKNHQPKEWRPPGYCCTGYLTVFKKRDLDFVIHDRTLNSDFRDRYRRDVRNHQMGNAKCGDRECHKRTDRIARLFPKNFVYGYSTKSGSPETVRFEETRQRNPNGNLQQAVTDYTR